MDEVLCRCRGPEHPARDSEGHSACNVERAKGYLSALILSIIGPAFGFFLAYSSYKCAVTACHFAISAGWTTFTPCPFSCSRAFAVFARLTFRCSANASFAEVRTRVWRSLGRPSNHFAFTRTAFAKNQW